MSPWQQASEVANYQLQQANNALVNQQSQQATDAGVVNEQQHDPQTDSSQQASGVTEAGDALQDAIDKMKTLADSLEKEKHEGFVLPSSQEQEAVNPSMLSGLSDNGAAMTHPSVDVAQAPLPVQAPPTVVPRPSFAMPQAPVVMPQGLGALHQSSGSTGLVGTSGLPSPAQSLGITVPSSVANAALLSSAATRAITPNVGASPVDIEAFLAKWEVDDRAAASFRAAAPETQHKVIASFAPKDLSRGASVALMGFLKHVRTKVAEEQEQRRQIFLASITAFVDIWQLDDRAQTLLCSLDPDMMEKVMRDFAPKDISGGASKAFSGFVRALQKKAQDAAAALAAQPPLLALTGGVPTQQLALTAGPSMGNPPLYTSIAKTSQMARTSPY